MHADRHELGIEYSAGMQVSEFSSLPKLNIESRLACLVIDVGIGRNSHNVPKCTLEYSHVCRT